MLGENPEQDAKELFDLVERRHTVKEVLSDIKLANIDNTEVPINSINHKTHYVILMEKETQILSNHGRPFLFSKKIYGYIVSLASELRGVIHRADKVLTPAQKSLITTVYVVDRKKTRKLTKYERKKLAFKKAQEEASKLADSTERKDNTSNMEVSPVQGGEHQSVSGEQTAQVHELHSNNNTQQNKGDQ